MNNNLACLIENYVLAVIKKKVEVLEYYFLMPTRMKIRVINK